MPAINVKVDISKTSDMFILYQCTFRDKNSNRQQLLHLKSLTFITAQTDSLGQSEEAWDVRPLLHCAEEAGVLTDIC